MVGITTPSILRRVILLAITVTVAVACTSSTSGGSGGSSGGSDTGSEAGTGGEATHPDDGGLQDACIVDAYLHLVCGTDGKTYDNDEVATKCAGVGIAHVGACDGG